MTPEAGAYVDKAREYLAKAHKLLEVVHYPDEAGRAAYLAAFHAAQALLFARTGRVAKTHAGLRSAFARLSREEPHLDRTMARFLAGAYKIKEISDYGIGPQAIVTITDAQETIEAAERFVDRIARILT